MRLIIMKKTLLSLAMAGAFLAPQVVSAHSSILEKEVTASVMTDHSSSYLTIQVPHGCKDEAENEYPTKALIIKFPNSQADIDSGNFFANVAPVASYYGVRTKTEKRTINGEESDQVTEIAITGLNVPYKSTFKAELFRGKPILKEGLEEAELNFDIIQYCPNGTTAAWTVENGKAGHVTVKKAEVSEHADH